MFERKIQNISLSRRKFLIGSASTAGIFVLGVQLPVLGHAAANIDETVNNQSQINAFVGINENGVVTIRNPYIEMGQGTYTSIPMLVAEELDVAMENILVVQAPPGAEYRLLFNNTKRLTGGSRSVRMSFMALRQTGAIARKMLLDAAAKHWQVSTAELSTRNGQVLHADGRAPLGYGQLAKVAATLDVPKTESIKLKSEKQFNLLGKPVRRTDVEVKCNGQAEFGIDAKMEGMVYAAVRQSPVFDGEVQSFDAEALIANNKQIIAVEALPGAIAVIAKTFWAAKKAAEQLNVKFSSKASKKQSFSDSAYLAEMQESLDAVGVIAEQQVDAVEQVKTAKHHFSQDYHSPFLAHATMEPMNCTSVFKDGHMTVWASNQSIDMVLQAIMETTGLAEQNITIHTPFLGGGFGRRFMTDFVVQSVKLAKRHPGLPIKMVWTREEDLQHDFYRPPTAIRLRAGLDDKKQPVATHITVVGEGPRRRHWATPENPYTIDTSVVEGTVALPYKLINQTNYVYKPMHIPIGFWRSVGHSMNAFFTESFMDELAHESGLDPVEFRREQLSEAPRYLNVMEKAVSMARWRGQAWQAEDGRQHAMGVALHEAFGSIVSQVAEVSINDRDEIQVHKVWCAVDCGFAVNPKIVTMQMESAIAFGLSAALMEKINIEQGSVQQSNFDSYPILPPQRMPQVEVAIINSGEALGGIGEPGTPPIAPAVGNALFTLTGVRLRSLPLDADALLEA